MNRTEQRRAERLEALRTLGQIHDWRYEPMKFRLADNTWLTPDFLVIENDGSVTLEDVKGRAKAGGPWVEEDARIKLKVAASRYPWFRWTIVWEAKGGAWNVEAIPVAP